MEGAARTFELYRKLINNHNFDQLEEHVLDSEITCVFGQDVHEGLLAVRRAFERAWQELPDECYEMSDPAWRTISDDVTVAVFTYEFAGTGGQGLSVTGGGQGTNIYRCTKVGWRLAHEHLSPSSAGKPNVWAPTLAQDKRRVRQVIGRK